MPSCNDVVQNEQLLRRCGVIGHRRRTIPTFDTVKNVLHAFNSHLFAKGKPVARPGRKAMGLPLEDCQAAEAVIPHSFGGSTWLPIVARVAIPSVAEVP